jgi:hypothetical protein
MFNTVTIGLSIALSIIAHFRWGWDSNPWVPWMFHYLLPPQNNTLPMFNLRPKNPLVSLSGFITYTNRSRRFFRNPMLSTSNIMINIGYHTSFRLETNSGYICRRSVSRGPIERFSHFSMGVTLSPRLWVKMILRSTLHPWPTSNVQFRPPLVIFSTIIGHLRDCKTTHTNRSQT